MPRILVTRPFEARFQPGKPRRQFPVGEHLLTQDEFDYWFVQFKIKAGYATVLPDVDQVREASQIEQSQAALEDEFLAAMNAPQEAAPPDSTPALDVKPVKLQAQAAPAKASAAKPKATAAKPKGKGK